MPYSVPMTPVNFDSYLPEGEALFDYQHVGVAYALVAAADGKGVFIADEQGLGKTRQAIVTAKIFNAKKILVVCKASLRGNWQREIVRCAPEWDVQILGGTRPFETFAQCVVINYDLLATWADSLALEGFDCMILDESHYVKSLGTPKKPVQRTVAALKLSESIRARKGLVLALTGTPFLNRPVELITQLQVLGRLEEIAPRPRRGVSLKDWEYSFKFSFCGPKQGHAGHWEFKGASNLDLLNSKMRGSCYVRRLRKEVLNMNDTRRIEVSLSLNGALDAYRAAERDLVSYLVAQGNSTSEAVRKVNPLTELSALRKLAGLAKIDAAVEWINSFLEENPTKKLVVWAWHIEVQKALAKAVDGAIYFAGSKDIEDAKREFNEGEARVLICSLQAHREGHTLVGDGTNVTDCLFVENPWHFGAVSQAEDRINRIGQKANQVFAWTLIAADADVDSWLADLIASKASTFKAGADGSIVEIEETSNQSEILRRLREKGERA